MTDLHQIRERLRACDSTDPACRRWTCYLSGNWPPSILPEHRHPLLFDLEPGARLMIVGSQPGPAVHELGPGHVAYLQANANESPLGWTTGRQLAVWLADAYLKCPEPALGCSHSTVRHALERIQRSSGADLDAALRAFRGTGVYPVHGTNLVKCHSPEKIETSDTRFRHLARACMPRHLAAEIETLRPGAIITLGQDTTDEFAMHFGLPAYPEWLGLRLPFPQRRRRIGVVEFYWLPFYHPTFRGRNTPEFQRTLTRFTDTLAGLIATNFQ